MRHFAPCLADCPVIVSCDGYKVREKPKYRSGQVTREGGDAYEEFLKRLAKLNLGQIVRCEEREGFGFALKNALRHVRTPYVLVVQHDRNFVRPADVEAVVRCLEANAETVKYVMLPTTTCLHYARLVLSKYRLRIEATRPEGFDFGLMPLLQWYDSTHVCSTRHYRDFVYRGDLVKRGGFVEDKLGQYQLADIRANGLDAHAKYAQFVLDDGVDAPMVSHLDGHDALSFRKFSFIRRDFDAPGDDGARANGDAR
mmetsp:Transcript_20137/g.63357  ORF Transcript_20137/g.63357 Transcript_20137/m.63357 type:complete len:255 (-) Transcript_20137:28-792(-)